MAQEGDSITLTCTEGESIPPADTTWRKGFRQEDIVPGFKYSLSEEGPVLRLTIHNVSRDDQDVYFCHSENLLGVRELEVFLTVRSESGVTVHSSYTHWYIQMEMQKDLSWTLTEFSRCRPPCRPFHWSVTGARMCRNVDQPSPPPFVSLHSLICIHGSDHRGLRGSSHCSLAYCLCQVALLQPAQDMLRWFVQKPPPVKQIKTIKLWVVWHNFVFLICFSVFQAVLSGE